MYYAQTMDKILTGAGNRYRVYRYSVAVAPNGRPIWKTAAVSDVHYDRASLRRAWQDSRIPFLPRLDEGKKVTWREAQRIAPVVGPPALDWLAEHANDEPNAVSNYVKPPKEKKQKVPPTAGEILAGKLAHVEAKVAEWEAKIARCETILKKWQRRAKYYGKKATKEVS